MKKYLPLLFIIASCLLPTLGIATTHSRNGTNLSAMLQTTMPAVVNITVQGQLPAFPYLPPYRRNPYAPGFPRRPGPSPFQRFPQNGGPKFQEMGSGVIVDAKNGYIITNSHVIKNAKSIIITLSDARRIRAKVIGSDKNTDIAVLQIHAPHLVALQFANSNNLKVGNFVAAIGNPFGLHQTVTSGVISALNRRLGIEGPQGYENFIQTDAPINPGNSGGALVDMSGKLVGINTAILTPMRGNIGIGFAVPSNMAHQVMNQLIKYGKVRRGRLGVVVQDFTPNLADAFHLAGVKGALVTKVSPGSAAAKAGLKAKDILETINGARVRNAAQLRSLVGLIPVGEALTLQVRRGKSTLTLTAKIESPHPLHATTPQSPINLLAGVRLENYDAYSPTTGEMKGVQVTHVADTSDAWLGQLRPGDVITTANGVHVANIDQLLTAVSQDKKQILFQVWRSGGTLFIVIS